MGHETWASFISSPNYEAFCVSYLCFTPMFHPSRLRLCFIPRFIHHSWHCRASYIYTAGRRLLLFTEQGAVRLLGAGVWQWPSKYKQSASQVQGVRRVSEEVVARVQACKQRFWRVPLLVREQGGQQQAELWPRPSLEARARVSWTGPRALWAHPAKPKFVFGFQWRPRPCLATWSWWQVWKYFYVLHVLHVRRAKPSMSYISYIGNLEVHKSFSFYSTM